MRVSTLSVLGLAGAAVALDPEIKTTKTVEKTTVRTSTDVVTSTKVVEKTVKTTATTTVVSTVFGTVTQTQPAQTVTMPASTVTIPASTVTMPASTITMPASTVTVTVGGSSSSSSSRSSTTTSSSSSSSSMTSSRNSTMTSMTTTSAAAVNYPQSTQWTATQASSVYAAAATALTTSPTSDVEGFSFKRFITVWMENTDYSLASTDPNLSYLASLGITLSNYYGLTHPSQPNYVASHGGDHFGIDSDSLFFIDSRVSTVFDLLDTKNISWGEYQENMPFSGFEGKAWINQTSGQNNYVRKHNPGTIFNSASQSSQRLSQMKNFSMFYTDLENQQLPQWMFVTPNELNDAHDTGVTYGGNWARQFFEPLMQNPYFWNETLILVTFDETETYSQSNNVYSFLIGGAIPQSKVNTTDANYYNHYSQISTVSANWDLPTLGRWDVGANVYEVVAEKTGDTMQAWTAGAGMPALQNIYFNQSYAGPFNSVKNTTKYPVNGNVYPVPNVNAVNAAGRAVLPSVVSQWAGMTGTYYTTGLEVNDGQHYPAGWCALSSTC